MNTTFKQDMAKIQQLVGEAFTVTGGLVALADGGTMNDAKLQATLEKATGCFERSVLELRQLCERYSTGVGGYGKRPVTPCQSVSGHVQYIGYNWLHIQLNTLLPHCRYQPPTWLSDTIRRLLDDFEAQGNTMPFYSKKVLLAIDEHSNIDGRHVYDQDNKGWKAVCNALKGRVIPDDDQYTLAVALLSTHSSENICHITMMDMADAADFFALHSGDYAIINLYEGPCPIR